MAWAFERGLPMKPTTYGGGEHTVAVSRIAPSQKTRCQMVGTPADGVLRRVGRDRGVSQSASTMPVEWQEPVDRGESESRSGDRGVV
jgi:hypothetical protein